MRKAGRSRVEEQTAAKQWHLPLSEFFHAALWDTVVVSGFEFAREQLEAERAALRAGHAKSSLTLGGRRAEIERPRDAAVRAMSLRCRAGKPGARAIRWSAGRSSR